jgi:uncharacterized SAM-binding protein YcdF (DUF218 family)
MFFLFSKLLNFLIHPLTWVFVLLVYALITKNDRRRRRLLIILIIGMYVLSNSFIASSAMHAWEVPAVCEDDLQTYDAGIILGGMMTYDLKLKKYQFMGPVDRLLQALELYKKGKIRKIVFTGGSGSLTYSYVKEGFLIRNYMLRLGIPPKDMFIESNSLNTHENALFTKPILDRELKGGRFLLITSAYHMRRSLGCFAKAGIAVTPYSTDRHSGEPKFVFDHLFIPSTDAIETWELLIHEITGYLTYKVAGYI